MPGCTCYIQTPQYPSGSMHSTHIHMYYSRHAYKHMVPSVRVTFVHKNIEEYNNYNRFV